MLRPYTTPTHTPGGGLHGPARAVLRAHVLGRNLGVRDLAGVSIDLEHLGRAQRQVAEQYHLGERPGVVGEVRARGCPTLARRDPLGVHALQPRVLLRRRVSGDLRLTGFVEQARVLAVDPGHELALVADPQLAARIEWPQRRVRDFFGARRVQAAVAPHHLDLGAIALGGEGVRDARNRRRGLAEQLGRFGLDARGVAQAERPERRVHRVAGDVAQRAGAEIPPAAPLERCICRVVGPRGGGTEPQVPVDPGRRVVLLERPLDGLRPDRPVGPQLDLAYRADGARLDPFPYLARPFAGVPLIPHLGSDLGLARGLHQLAHLPQRTRQRLLDARVLAQLHRHHPGHRVHVIGRRDGDGVDVLRFLLEHHTKIFEAFGFGEGGEGLRGLVLVHVAQRVDVLRLPHALHVVRAHPAHTDAGDVELVARGRETTTQHVPRYDGEGDAGAHVADELTSRDAFACHDVIYLIGRHGLARRRGVGAEERGEQYQDDRSERGGEQPEG